jgi:hypothetical protein
VKLTNYLDKKSYLITHLATPAYSQHNGCSYREKERETERDTMVIHAYLSVFFSFLARQKVLTNQMKD